MISKPISCVVAVVLALILALPAFTQGPQQGPNQTTIPGQRPQGVQLGTQTGGAVPERRPPAAEYGLAIIATLGILVIVCMPSRKR
jgi:hypothetical protein